MAQANSWEDVFSGLRFYNSNILKGVTEWEKDGDVTDHGSGVYIGPGASISFELTNDFMEDSLSMSEFRQIKVRVNNTNDCITDDSNLNKIPPMLIAGSVFIRLDTTYSNDVTQYVETQEFILSEASGTYKISGSKQRMDFKFIVSTFNMNILSQVITITNNSTQNTCQLSFCKMYRSQDVTQVGENTRTSMTVTDITAYKDGLTVQFDSKSAPVRMWWQEDEDGNFSGVNIDGERMITFKRVNQSLPQQEDS